MSALARDFSVTFGGVERLFGTLAGSAALLSWVLKVKPLTVSELITRLVEAYRALIHPAMEALLGLLPFDLPNWWNDVAALYIVAGGAVSRTLWVFYKDHREAEGENYGPAFVGGFKRRATQTLAVILSIPFWPLSLIAMLERRT